MCGFGSDGAAVMVGRINEVAARLKARQPCILAVRYVNYRLVLAAAYVANQIPYLHKFKTTIRALFLLYQNSSR